jgi:hypothetical protein
MAVRATFALKAGVWLRRGLFAAIIAAIRNSTYPAVQIL